MVSSSPVPYFLLSLRPDRASTLRSTGVLQSAYVPAMYREHTLTAPATFTGLRRPRVPSPAASSRRYSACSPLFG